MGVLYLKQKEMEPDKHPWSFTCVSGLQKSSKQFCFIFFKCVFSVYIVGLAMINLQKKIFISVLNPIFFCLKKSVVPFLNVPIWILTVSREKKKKKKKDKCQKSYFCLVWYIYIYLYQGLDGSIVCCYIACLVS